MDGQDSVFYLTVIQCFRAAELDANKSSGGWTDKFQGRHAWQMFPYKESQL